MQILQLQIIESTVSDGLSQLAILLHVFLAFKDGILFNLFKDLTS